MPLGGRSEYWSRLQARRLCEWGTFVCERQCGSASVAARVNTSGVREVYKKMTDPMPLREPTPVIMQTLPLRREVRGAFWR